MCEFVHVCVLGYGVCVWGMVVCVCVGGVRCVKVCVGYGVCVWGMCIWEYRWRV